MIIRDRSEKVKAFEELAGGDIFRYNGAYYVKLRNPVVIGFEERSGEDITYNAVDLTRGDYRKFETYSIVEPMAGHTLALLVALAVRKMRGDEDTWIMALFWLLAAAWLIYVHLTVKGMTG